ncbi:hypothetical protein SDC9_138631 [bioreactor metagenome]|uniref:FCP1 homology domain-containing protein n=1 Tax=bioreactor metagenome TaxID=1076179 RepID=A0A645DPU1_9ZZZZ
MIMNRRVILFDIDKTLLNPYLILKDLGNEIKNKFHKNVDILEVHAEYVKKLESSTDFDAKDFLIFLSKKTEISFDKLNKYFYNSKLWESYVYEGTKELLDKIKFDFDLGIFSEGFDVSQNEKLEMSKLDIFFKKDLLFISRRKLNNDFLKTLPKKAIVVDDKKEVMETLKQLRPDLELIWINRTNDEKMENVKIIKSLKELENFI